LFEKEWGIAGQKLKCAGMRRSKTVLEIMNGRMRDDRVPCKILL